ncbi:MAG: PaaI family thioesterase [Bryobacterales bacterium]|nr:PaaI family thioesterase [Bryobacterales bacterium]
MPRISTAALRRLMSELPFNSLLGLKLQRRHEDGVTIECPLKPEHTNIHKTMHGGVTATRVDVAGGFATMAHYGGRPCATVEMKINYLLPITGKWARARAKLVRTGATLCVAQVEVHDPRGRLAAAGLITYMLLDARGKAATA